MPTEENTPKPRRGRPPAGAESVNKVVSATLTSSEFDDLESTRADVKRSSWIRSAVVEKLQRDNAQRLLL
jgi:hypothetical protein